MNKITGQLKAKAEIIGNELAPQLKGTVCFYNTPVGIKVSTLICNLPPNKTGFYGFHLHEIGDCSDNDFGGAGGHYNPNSLPHPMHAGDFPMLLATDNNDAYLTFVTTRFTIKEVINRSVIIHMDADDYTSQPSGNAGKRIGCGVIERIIFY